MQVNIEQLDPTKVQLTIEVDAETVAKTISDVYREYAKVTNIPGFRHGKAPRKILERYVPEETVNRRAAEIMIPDAYEEAIGANDIHPYADPDVDVVQYETGKPLIFTAVVPLPPKVELGEYKGIEVERPKVEITDEDVEAQLKYLLESRATSEKVEDRGIEVGDVAVAEIGTKVEGGEASEPRRSLIEVGNNIPGFDDNILGMKPGERKTFSLQYPADFQDENLAGKMADFDIAIDSLRKRIVPELNDDFAKSVASVDTVEELRADLKKRMIATTEDDADKAVDNQIIDEIVSRSTISFPDVMVEHDVHHEKEDLAKRLSRQGISLDQYLAQVGKTREEFEKDLHESAAQRVRIGLVLGEIVDKEGLDVSEEDIDAEIDRLAEESSASRETVETFLETRGGRRSLGNTMLNRKIVEFLKSVSVIK